MADSVAAVEVESVQAVVPEVSTASVEHHDEVTTTEQAVNSGTQSVAEPATIVAAELEAADAASLVQPAETAPASTAPTPALQAEEAAPVATVSEPSEAVTAAEPAVKVAEVVAAPVPEAKAAVAETVAEVVAAPVPEAKAAVAETVVEVVAAPVPEAKAAVAETVVEVVATPVPEAKAAVAETVVEVVAAPMPAAAEPAAAPEVAAVGGAGAIAVPAGGTPLVLVTGASGFIASWVIAGLLGLGYRVRGTVRSLAKKTAHLADLAPGSTHKLELVEADLTKGEGWDAAVAGCTYVLHVASPFLLETPKDVEKELMKPAVEGTLHVLRAVAAASPQPKRVVLTSSMASVAYGRSDPAGHLYTEADWTNAASKHPSVVPYVRSKVLAERAAWDFVNALPAAQKFELATVCPSTVFGPLLGKYDCASADIVKMFLCNGMSYVPALRLPAVDVRDVARVHILAMTAPQAAGHRFPISTGAISMRDLAVQLAAEFNPQGYKVATGHLSTWFLKAVSVFGGQAAVIASQIDTSPPLSALAECKEFLGMVPTDFHTDFSSCLKEMAYSMVRQGVVPDKSQGAALSARPGVWGGEAGVAGLPHLTA